jgi:hypothetical protein
MDNNPEEGESDRKRVYIDFEELGIKKIPIPGEERLIVVVEKTAIDISD